MNEINLEFIKKDLIFFNKFISKLDHYSLFYLTDTSNIKMNCFDILENWKSVKNDILNGKKSEKLDMYIHIPFCNDFCDFCVFFKEKINSDISGDKKLDNYVNYLIKMMEFYAPTFQGLSFSSIFLGGGTPSILNDKQMEKLFSKIFELFTFKEYAYKGIEFRPNTFTENKIKIIKKYGFETIHIGVQSLNKDMLIDMNRGEDDEKQVEKCIKLCKKYEFEDIAVHVIKGLKGDNVNNFILTIEKLCKLGVDTIFVYSLITKKSYLKKIGLDRDDFYENYYKKFCEEIDYVLKDTYSKYGYVSSNFGQLTFRIKRKNFVYKKQHFKYHGDARVNSNNLGFGPSSRSIIDKTLSYHNINEIKYSFAPQDYIYISNNLSEKDEMKKFIIISFRDNNKVSISKFKESFGKNIFDEFKEEISILEFLGKIKIEEDNINFLEKKHKMKMLYCCFIVGRDGIKNKILQNNWNINW